MARTAQRLRQRLDLAAVCCLLAGVVSVFAFAPFMLWWLAPLCLAVLFRSQLQDIDRAPWLGWCFGLGQFLFGVHWIYISLHDHGGMPAAFAAAALFLFAAFCALLPAVAGLLARSLQRRVAAVRAEYAVSNDADAQGPAGPGGSGLTALLLLPAAWVLAEWTRTWFCTGFPWLALGYSQIPDGPLAGWAVLGGVYAVSLALACLAGALAWLLLPRDSGVGAASGRGARAAIGLGLATLLVLIAQAGASHAWTRANGRPVSAALIQGNIDQDAKFDPAFLAQGLARYRDLAAASQAQLVVMPESAVPLLRQEVPEDYLESLRAIGRARHGDLLVGMFDETVPGEIHNSMVSLGSAPLQIYRKHHLVPFGEFIPLQGLVAPVMNALLRMPIGSQAAAPLGQGLMAVAGQQIAMDICYEDAFGEEIITALPQASALVNVSNDAWFGLAVGPEQHLQMAQARALESGREMLRATNTGVTAFIGADGRVVQRAAKAEVAVLEGSLQGRSGATPFVRIGNLPVVWACLLMLGRFVIQRRQRHRPAEPDSAKIPPDPMQD